MAVYLKSPRRKRKKIRQCFEKYRCVPKIASPEVRTNKSKCCEKYRCESKTASPEARQKIRRCCESIVVYLKSLTLRVVLLRLSCGVLLPFLCHLCLVFVWPSLCRVLVCLCLGFVFVLVFVFSSIPLSCLVSSCLFLIVSCLVFVSS